MSRRTLIWIIASVVLIHGALFLVFGRMRALPKPRVKVAPTPNFKYEEAVLENAKTGERTIYRDFEISTQLADPKLLPATPAPATPDPARP